MLHERQARACAWCKTMFTPKRADAIYHAKSCARAAWNEKRKTQPKFRKVQNEPDAERNDQGEPVCRVHNASQVYGSHPMTGVTMVRCVGGCGWRPLQRRLSA